MADCLGGIEGEKSRLDPHTTAKIANFVNLKKKKLILTYFL